MSSDYNYIHTELYEYLKCFESKSLSKEKSDILIETFFKLKLSECEKDRDQMIRWMFIGMCIDKQLS